MPKDAEPTWYFCPPTVESFDCLRCKGVKVQARGGPADGGMFCCPNPPNGVVELLFEWEGKKYRYRVDFKAKRAFLTDHPPVKITPA